MATTVNYQVGQSSDDAVEIWAGSPVINGTGLHISGTDDYAAFRFQSVAVPQGATIDAATLSIFCLDAGDVTMEADIYGEDEDDAATFTTTNGNVDGRTKTTASVAWSTTLTATGVFNDSPDIATVIQEIVNRVGWSSGNDLVILVVSNDPSCDAQCRTYDNDSARGAKLEIEYSTSGSIVPLRRRRM